MPIELYVGPQGTGKTYCMVKEAIIPALKHLEWIVLSNMRVTAHGRTTIDITDGDHIDYQLLTQIINHNLAREKPRPVLLAVDEIGAAMPQELWRSAAGLRIISLILQLRKSRIDMVGTVQNFDRAVKIVRDNTNLVHLCRVFTRTWFWWHRDTQGVLNRRTGNYYKLPWLFEIESLQPHALHLQDMSPARKRARAGWRKVRFDKHTAAAFDTYQRIGLDPSATTAPSLTSADELVSEGDLTTVLSHHIEADHAQPPATED